MSVEEIMAETGLDEARTRGALYARSLKGKLQKKIIKKRMTFRLAAETDRPNGQRVKEEKAPSTAEQIKGVLQRFPDGLQRRRICGELPLVKPATLSAALYHMTNRSEIEFDEADGRYHLPIR